MVVTVLTCGTDWKSPTTATFAALDFVVTRSAIDAGGRVRGITRAGRRRVEPQTGR